MVFQAGERVFVKAFGQNGCDIPPQTGIITGAYWHDHSYCVKVANGCTYWAREENIERLSDLRKWRNDIRFGPYTYAIGDLNNGGGIMFKAGVNVYFVIIDGKIVYSGESFSDTKTTQNMVEKLLGYKND